jgi:hypothetical protein
VSALRDVSVGTIEEMVQADALREVMIADLRELEAVRFELVERTWRDTADSGRRLRAQLWR